MSLLLKITLCNEVAALKEFSDPAKCERAKFLKDDPNICTHEPP
jgi:hypothetical protein